MFAAKKNNTNKTTQDNKSSAQLAKIIKSLDRVSNEKKTEIYKLACALSEDEILQAFIQGSFDMFNLLIEITGKRNIENEYKFGGFKVLFEAALKLDARLPLEKFTLIILEYAAEIYDEEEDFFLGLDIPDQEVDVKNEFGIIRSEKFKQLWKILDKKSKNDISDSIILITGYAHAYMYKTVLKCARV